MAEEGPGSSIADSSSTTNFWELNENSLSSWWNHPDSNFSSEEDPSLPDLFTNTLNQSGWINADDFSSELMEPQGSRQKPNIVQSGAESALDSSLWSTILSNIENGGLHNNHGVGGNFLEELSSDNQRTDMFALVCDYAKKMDTSNNSWEFAKLTPYNNFSTTDESTLGNDRIDNFSNLVTDWSLSTPESNLSRFLPSYAQHEMEVENLQQQIEAWDFLSEKSFKSNTSTRYQTGSGSLAYNNKNNYYEMSSEAPWFNITSFNGSLNKHIIDHPSSETTCLKASYQIDNKKRKEISSAPTSARRSTTGLKKKRSEDSSDTQFKKPMHENSTVQAAKVHEAKLNERMSISSLQQIVSPFGKTGKASVLKEAIRYIKDLQEQVQLLSNPYMKPPEIHKYRWGMQERKDKSEAKSDLRSRGLCLVPISCLPQVYKETTGSDQITELTYRGCLYR